MDVGNKERIEKKQNRKRKRSVGTVRTEGMRAHSHSSYFIFSLFLHVLKQLYRSFSLSTPPRNYSTPIFFISLHLHKTLYPSLFLCVFSRPQVPSSLSVCTKTVSISRRNCLSLSLVMCYRNCLSVCLSVRQHLQTLYVDGLTIWWTCRRQFNAVHHSSRLASN